ncbi:Rhomboid-related protein 1 [Chionoecetes opilio]|uniref:Rhomboid-related protein 1 n=1 Tax=Chionoecetes opilio TaxID=41210 RepID=A0A8J4XPM7_CHIOP|nr:Rhomboid-related protein 1 [Chionoecetes opilio]
MVSDQFVAKIRLCNAAITRHSYMHLTMNLIMQTLLGLLLELVHGWWRVGIIYMSGVLAGSLSQSLAMPRAYLAGASGGVYAIVYAHLGNLLLSVFLVTQNWSEMEFRWAQLLVCLGLSLGDISLALWDTYGSDTPSNTGHLAHLGGAIAGVLVGIYVLRNLRKRRWEKYCWWVAIILYFLLIGTGVILNATLPAPDFFPPNE